MNDEDLKTKNDLAKKALLDAIKDLKLTLKLVNTRCKDDMCADFIADRLKTAYTCILRDFVRRSPVEILADEYGLHLRRYADNLRVRLLGVREWNGSRKIWEIDVDKVHHNAVIIEGGESLMSITGSKSNDVEQTAIKGLICILKERLRCSHSQRKIRKAKTKEVKA